MLWPYCVPWTQYNISGVTGGHTMKVHCCHALNSPHTVLSHLVKGALPDNKLYGANMGATWVLSAPDGPHVGPMNLAISAIMLKILPVYLHIFYFVGFRRMSMTRRQSSEILLAMASFRWQVSVPSTPHYSSLPQPRAGDITISQFRSIFLSENIRIEKKNIENQLIDSLGWFW